MKIDRLLSMIIYLLNHRQTSAPELARHFNVSVRTVYRDLECLSLAGIPVTSRQGYQGGISLMESFRMDRQLFSSPELQAMIMALKGVSSALSDQSLSKALEKMQSFGQQDAAEDNLISIDFSPWHQSEKFRETLHLLTVALQKNRVLGFRYRSLKGESLQRSVEPIRLIFRDSAWYLAAWCRLRRDYRFFRISRIEAPQLLPEIYTPRQLDARELAEATAWPTERQTSVVVRARPEDRDRLLNRLKSSGFLYHPESDAIRIQVPLEDWVYSWLLGMADLVQIVSPDSFRQELLSRVEKFKKNNSNLT